MNTECDRGQDCGTRRAQCGQQANIPAGPGDQVAGVRVLDDLRRQGQHVGHECLAECGQDLLAEHGRGVRREPDQHGLGHQEHQISATVPRHRVVVLGHVRDQVAEQPRDEKAGDRAERLQAGDQDEFGRVGPDDAPYIGGKLAVGGDGQRAHAAAIPRSTRARYRASAHQGSWVPSAATVPSMTRTTLIGLVQQQNAGGEHDGGAVRCAQPGDSLGHPALGMRVDRARGVDQDQYFRVGHQGPGQPQPLLLAAGELPASRGRWYRAVRAVPR